MYVITTSALKNIITEIVFYYLSPSKRAKRLNKCLHSRTPNGKHIHLSHAYYHNAKKRDFVYFQVF